MRWCIESRERRGESGWCFSSPSCSSSFGGGGISSGISCFFVRHLSGGARHDSWSLATCSCVSAVFGRSFWRVNMLSKFVKVQPVGVDGCGR